MEYSIIRRIWFWVITFLVGTVVVFFFILMIGAIMGFQEMALLVFILAGIIVGSICIIVLLSNILYELESKSQK